MDSAPQSTEAADPLTHCTRFHVVFILLTRYQTISATDCNSMY